MNKIGSLYQVKKLYWLVFPNKEIIAVAGLAELEVLADLASDSAAYYSKRYNCNVTYLSPEDIVVLLETDGKYKKLLTAKGEMGYTWYNDEYNESFEELNQT